MPINQGNRLKKKKIGMTGFFRPFFYSTTPNSRLEGSYGKEYKPKSFCDGEFLMFLNDSP